MSEQMKPEVDPLNRAVQLKTRAIRNKAHPLMIQRLHNQITKLSLEALVQFKAAGIEVLK